MVIQETTHGRSSLSIDRAMIGSHLPMMRISAGWAYLTFCDETQRNLILKHIRRVGDPADEPFLEPLWLARMMYETRERGLALRDAGEFRTKTASLAAPIMKPGGIVGCVSMIWIRSALSTGEAIANYSTSLTELACRIAAAMPD
jgi:IclR family transcriptional regulator, mhp operon transcriptional activator